jgi:hypothetical protein
VFAVITRANTEAINSAVSDAAYALVSNSTKKSRRSFPMKKMLSLKELWRREEAAWNAYLTKVHEDAVASKGALAKKIAKWEAYRDAVAARERAEEAEKKKA